MQLIRGLHNIRPEHRACVATIGNFDGVHLGHRTILDALKQQAFELGVRVCVITFEPQPREFFMGHRAPARLTSLREKLTLLEAAGVDQVLCLPFGDKLQNMTPDNFVLKTLVHGLGIRYLIVGDDFRYGLNRAGDFAHVRRMGDEHGFEVCDTRTVTLDMDRISSTRVRDLLAKAALREAETLLGRPFAMFGRVVKGQQLGRQLGFPTANIRVCRNRLPLQGVFAVRGWLECQDSLKSFAGVANLGTRPTVDATTALLEVHLLDFQDDLYGRTLRVEFIEKIRDAKKFESLENLQAAIREDVARARDILGG